MKSLQTHGRINKLLKRAERLLESPICLYIIIDSCMIIAAGKPWMKYTLGTQVPGERVLLNIFSPCISRYNCKPAVPIKVCASAAKVELLLFFS